MTQEEEDISENTSEHVLADDGFSKDSKRFFSLSISSFLNLETKLCEFPSLFG